MTLMMFGDRFEFKSNSEGNFINGKFLTDRELDLELAGMEGDVVCTNENILQLTSDSNKEKFREDLNNYHMFALCWDYDKNRAFLKVKTSDSLRVTGNIEQNSINGSFISCFNDEGKYLYRFADANNKKAGNLVSCAFMHYSDSNIYAKDTRGSRISKFNITEKAIIEKIIDPESVITGNQFTVRGNKFVAAGNKNFPTETFSTSSIYDILDDPEYTEAQFLANPKEILNLETKWQVSKFEEIITKPMKKAGVDWDALDSTLKSLYVSIWTGGLFFHSNFSWYSDEVFYALSPWGTDIIKYNTDGDSLDNYQLEIFTEYRNRELNQLRSDYNMANPKEIFTVPRFMFYDSNQNNLLIFYHN